MRGASGCCFAAGTAARKELDLIIGRFADAHLPALTDAELDQLERILEAPDPELYAAFTGEAPVPQDVAGTVFEQDEVVSRRGPGP